MNPNWCVMPPLFYRVYLNSERRESSVLEMMMRIHLCVFFIFYLFGSFDVSQLVFFFRNSVRCLITIQPLNWRCICVHMSDVLPPPPLLLLLLLHMNASNTSIRMNPRRNRLGCCAKQITHEDAQKHKHTHTHKITSWNSKAWNWNNNMCERAGSCAAVRHTSSTSSIRHVILLEYTSTCYALNNNKIWLNIHHRHRRLRCWHRQRCASR